MKKFSVESLGFDRFSGLYVWAMFIIVFGLLKPDLFLTQSTLHSVAVTQAVTAMLGLAVVIPLAAGVFDLSIGANIQFCAIVVSMMQQKWHHGMWTSIIVAILCGVAIGVINGILVVVLQVSSFIATLGMATVISAVQTIVTDNLDPLPALTPGWVDLTQRTFLGIQMVFWYLIILAAILWFVLERMPIGRYIRAVGSNAEAARLSGIRVGKYWFLSLVICGTVSAIAGVCYASNVGPSLTFGNALLLPAYAAAFLGFTQITPGRFNVIGAVIAVYTLATGVQGLELITSVQWLSDMFNGVTLILAVVFAVWRQRAQKNKKATSPAGSHAQTEDGAASPVPAESPV